MQVWSLNDKEIYSNLFMEDLQIEGTSGIGSSFREKRVENASLVKCNLLKCQAINQRFNGITFSECCFISVDFIKCSFVTCIFDKCTFISGSLSDCWLHKTGFKDVIFDKESPLLIENCEYKKSYFMNMDLTSNNTNCLFLNSMFKSVRVDSLNRIQTCTFDSCDFDESDYLNLLVELRKFNTIQEKINKSRRNLLSNK